MANMSYCRFENTLRDLRDCANVMLPYEVDQEELNNKDEEPEGTLSESETNARRSLIELCVEIAAALGDEEDWA